MEQSSLNPTESSSATTEELRVNKEDTLIKKGDRSGHCISKSSFKNLLFSLTPSYNWKNEAVESLHSASEIYMQQYFEDTNLITEHCKRKTLLVKDMKLAQRIRGDRQF